MGYQYFKTTDRGYLPAGSDITGVLRDGDERELHAVWDTYHHIRFTTETLTKFSAGLAAGEPAHPEVDLEALWRAEIAALAPVTALQALEANRRLVDVLTGRRWSTMQAAREDGASWSAVGTALDMTKQGALDWYQRKIEQQEKYVPDYHDAERARAVVADIVDSADDTVGQSANKDAAAMADHLRSLATVPDGAAYLDGLGLDVAALREVAAALGCTRLPARMSRKALCERVLQQAIGSRNKYEGLRSW
jgi:hypothetical protein